MAPSNSRGNYIISLRKFQRGRRVRGPGVVISVTSPQKGFKLFIASVAELSPDMEMDEAWRYPSLGEANDGARLASPGGLFAPPRRPP